MSEKINTKQIFQKILKQKNTFHSKNLYIKTIFLPEFNKNGFYFVISKKIIKNAVNRNLFKRRGRDIARSIKTKNGYIAIFFAKNGVQNIKYYDLKSEILFLIKKAGILSVNTEKTR